MSAGWKMRVLFLLAIFLLLAGYSGAGEEKGETGAGKGEIPDHPTKLKFEPLKFEPPKADDYRVKLSNGMIVYIAEDRELPTFDMEITVRAGSLYEPVGKTGLASACGALLKQGGTKTMTGEEINEYMEELAGSLRTEIGLTSGSVSLSVLKEDINNGLKVLADVLMNPVFAEDELRRYRERALQNLEHRYDRPRGLLRDVSGKLLYGKHPVARIPSKSALVSITRKDLAAFHKKYFFPNNCIMAVAGDFDREDMIKRLELLFATWKPGEVDFPEVKDIEQNFDSGVFLLEKDINQGYVRIGHPGIRDDNPDVYAVRLMSTILGGSGTMSRIPGRIRNDEGLSYSVGAYFRIPVEYSGAFLCSFQTKCKSVAFGVSIVMEEVKRIRSELVSEEELAQAKDMYIETFPSMFSGRGSSAYAKVQALAENEYRRRPLDYFDKYRDNFRKITRERILEVSKKYLHPEGLKIIVVGKIDEMTAGDGQHEAKLGDFGEVKKLKAPDLMK
ncbi:MAG: M16 family metallopeptidase [Planctomycetota bacterium]|jgi:predicted Zn-dependent peptidase